MCGIAGIVGFDKTPSTRHIGGMTASLRPRGPDDEGYLLADTSQGSWVACAGAETIPELSLSPLARYERSAYDLPLGHRRLAILDLSEAGHGSMSSFSKQMSIKCHSG
jgi:asparagine synthase (glutamine-hydrolysing)